MKWTILIPHYKTGKITAHAVAKLLEFKGSHELDIIIIDNSYPDSSLMYCQPVVDLITEHPKDGVRFKVVSNPPGRMQSHGIAFDLAMQRVETEYFITLESDSFPINGDWLNYYEKLVKEGVDCAGSLLTLSGGQYIHPCGAMYRKTVWEEARKYCDEINKLYAYFPNIAMREGFPSHLMVSRMALNSFTVSPEEFGITRHSSYEGLTPGEIEHRAIAYLPVTGPFHNGMGSSQETFNTYRFRNVATERERIDVLDKTSAMIIYRMGFEPGQWFTYWQLWMGKKVMSIPTATKWLPNRENQQQEYTLMESGVKHLWGVSAYDGCDVPEVQDIVAFKKRQVDELYDSLPGNLKYTPS